MGMERLTMLRYGVTDLRAHEGMEGMDMSHAESANSRG